MRALIVIANLVACSLAIAQPKASEPPLKLPGPLSPAEAAALEAKGKKEHDEAMARLPVLTRDRLKHILDVLGETEYPVRFDVLCEKLGGPDSLVWCCTRSRLGEKIAKRTSTYFVASDATEYELVVDFEDSSIDKPSLMVGRVRLCFSSPFGWRFEAEAEDDFLGAGVPEKKPNQPLKVTGPGCPPEKPQLY